MSEDTNTGFGIASFGVQLSQWEKAAIAHFDSPDDISDLSGSEANTWCDRLELSKAGNVETRKNRILGHLSKLRKVRDAEEGPEIAEDGEDDRKPQAKRLKTTIDISDLRCPIAREIPTEPVIATDQLLYNKESLETHAKNAHPGAPVLSPVSRVPLSGEFQESAYMVRVIFSLIQEGVIPPAEADDWLRRRTELSKKREKEKKKKYYQDLMDELEAQEDLPAEKAFPLGKALVSGEYIQEDKKLGLWLLRKAMRKGLRNDSKKEYFPRGLAKLAVVEMLDARSEEKLEDEVAGLVALGVACGRGSGYAAAQLKLAFGNNKKWTSTKGEDLLQVLDLLGQPAYPMSKEEKEEIERGDLEG